MQATYETFGCNDGNVFMMGIDKGNTNASVIYFDSVYGIHYPSASGNNGSGNMAHLLYNIQATPTVVIINPDRSIAVKQVYPPSQLSLTDSVLGAGGIEQACLTAIVENRGEELLLIRPNPVQDKAYIHFILKEESDVELILYDLSGREIWKQTPGKYAAGKFFIETSFNTVERGAFLLQLKCNGEQAALQKLILD